MKHNLSLICIFFLNLVIILTIYASILCYLTEPINKEREGAGVWGAVCTPVMPSDVTASAEFAPPHLWASSQSPLTQGQKKTDCVSRATPWISVCRGDGD